jgi:cell wall-associated NlpC family hydrolase
MPALSLNLPGGLFMTKSRRSRGVPLLSALLAASVLILPLSGVASAKTPKPTQAQIDAAKQAELAKQAAATAAQAKLNSATQTLNQLVAVANKAAAIYQQALKELAIATSKAKAAAAHAIQAQAAVAAANRTIGQSASSAYKMGNGFSNLNSILSANGPQDLVDRLTTLNKIGTGDAVILKRFKIAEAAAKAAKVEADRTKAVQADATAKVAATKKIADDAKAAQQKEVDKLRAVQSKLIAELTKAKNFRVTLEQQRQLAILEEQNATTASNTPNQKSIWPNRGFTGRTSIRSTEAIRLKAVAYAKAQVLARWPYVWGAQGPKSFDCSGLVYAAYRAAGLGYPEWGRLNAALYFVATKRIPLNQLLPGDLLFYSYDGSVQNIHHITIYEGNDMMWEANSKRAGLIHSNMYSIKGLMPFGGRV